MPHAKIVIVDYDVGNLRSVQNAFERVGAKAVVSRDTAQIERAAALVLPGVGAFGSCVDRLDRYRLREPVSDFIRSKRPFLGICVGYQLLFESSEENFGARGLAIFEGRSVKFQFEPGRDKKIPHIGWNQVSTASSRARPTLFEQIENNADFYFAHSYYPRPERDEIISSMTTYHDSFASSITHGSIFGVQFHPEKSQRVGLKLLANFAAIARKNATP